MKMWKWMMLVMLFSFLCLAFFASCEDEDDDDDDDDDSAPVDDDDAADDDDDDAAQDDDADADDDDSGDDDSGGDSSGACCSCADGYGPAPEGEQARLLVLRARKIFVDNPELRKTANDLLIGQNMIRHVPEDYRPLVLAALEPIEENIEPESNDPSIAFVRLYECGFALEDIDGFVMNLDEAIADSSQCVSACFGIDQTASCDDLADCVTLCLNE